MITLCLRHFFGGVAHNGLGNDKVEGGGDLDVLTIAFDEGD